MLRLTQRGFGDPHISIFKNLPRKVHECDISTVRAINP